MLAGATQGKIAHLDEASRLQYCHQSSYEKGGWLVKMTWKDSIPLLICQRNVFMRGHQCWIPKESERSQHATWRAGESNEMMKR